MSALRGPDRCEEKQQASRTRPSHAELVGSRGRSLSAPRGAYVRLPGTSLSDPSTKFGPHVRKRVPAPLYRSETWGYRDEGDTSRRVTTG